MRRITGILLLAPLLLALCGFGYDVKGHPGIAARDRAVTASVAAQLPITAPHWKFHVVAHRPDAQGRPCPTCAIAWSRDASNLVTRTGCSVLLTQVFKTPGAGTWFLGEILTFTSFATTDTMASHANWTSEGTTTTTITNATRPALTLGSASTAADAVTIDNSGSPASFTQNSTTTINGFYVTDSSTVGGTTGNLYGEATFTAAPVAAGYTLNVTATLTATAG